MSGNPDHLGFRRALYDLGHRVFVESNSLKEVFSAHALRLIAEIEAALESGRYKADEIAICEVPKSTFSHRPGAILSLRDSLMYSTIATLLTPQLDSVLIKTATVDFGNRRNSKPNDTTLFSEFFLNWRQFATSSIAACSSSDFVVVCDVAGYYENIDLHRLLGDLKAVDVSAKLVGLLQEMLYHWSAKSARGRGLPQGHSTSDLLAKFYLSGFDRSLVADGITHLRYNDDIRLFCSSEREAEKLLGRVIRELRKRGLILQTAKTRILSSDEAAKEFKKTILVIEGVKDHIVTEITSSIADPSVNAKELSAVLRDHPEIERRTVRAAFDQYFGAELESFDSSLFHYLLNQFGKSIDTYAVSRSIELLLTRPEESEHILNYFATLDNPGAFSPDVRAFLSPQFDDRSYQQYQILRWYGRMKVRISPQTMSSVRRFITSRHFPPYLRDAAKEVIRVAGTEDEFDAVEYHYEFDSSDESRALSVMAVQNQETSRRNLFYSRIGGRHPLVDTAIALVKQSISAG